MHEAITHTAVAVSYLWLIPALPALGVLVNLSLGALLGKGAVGFIAPGTVAGGFGVALYCLVQILQLPPGSALEQTLWPWISAGNLQVDIAFRVDALSAVMICVVTGVGFLIHIYSVGYMHDDPSYARYFIYLNLFTCAMLILVLADNLPLLFVGWEGVGLCSYLLIGFWFDKEANASAGKKAFVVNRVGDAGFLLGTFLLFWSLGVGTHSLSFQDIAAHAKSIPLDTVTLITLLLFVGATGKSAQLPLYVWLPDAMAGPTPVSALIHAATMVTAGVYMIARLNFLFVLAPATLTVVATIGALTALFAASIGLMQNDIKKVLAYSTVSQLGYMFLGVGVGAFSAGVFHLMTHAFFKGLLFLGSGSVIHGMHGEQDMRRMGGLRTYMPTTYRTFLIGTLAIAGVPGLAGFFSKDLILAHAFSSSPVLWLVGLCAAGMTAFYMFRLVFMTFWGECRADEHTKHHIHESPATMTVPLVLLAVLSIVGGYVGLPEMWAWGNRFDAFLAPVFAAAQGGEHHMEMGLEYALMAASVGVAVGGIALAYVLYVARPELPGQIADQAAGAYDLISNKYYVDELYDAVLVQPALKLSNLLWRVVDVGIVDGIVNGSARVVGASSSFWRRWQTGNVEHYAVSMLFGAVLILVFFAWHSS
ncbi:MAG: NADH-quinone oxidoreductase subunit L [Deltaproteobacteria bacterium]|nr:NADH-quinone oxidoreductase subunit L [Deltaproteobacteria bacterium]